MIIITNYYLKYVINSIFSHPFFLNIPIGNQIGSKGMKYLSESLKSNNSIQTLHLYNNNIGSEGMKYLSESLKSNNSIQTLGLESK